MANYFWPVNPSTSGPIEFILDGSTEVVTEDTGTPGNSIPLPVKVLDGSGVEVDFATEAKQDTQITELQQIEADIEASNALLTTIDTSLNNIEATDFATEAKQDTQITALADINTELDAQTALLTSIDGSFAGIATEAKQDTQITELQQIEADVEAGNALLTTIDTSLNNIEAVDFATQTTLAALNTKVPANLTVTSTRLLVDGSGVTQPISAAALPLPSGAATEATLATVNTSVTRLAVVDQIDTTPLLSMASTNIPASSSNPVEVVASLAANVKKIVSVEDSGEFIGLYTGAAASEVLNCVLPLGGGEIEVTIAAGTRISLRNMKNAAITTDFIALNFLG